MPAREGGSYLIVNGKAGLVKGSGAAKPEKETSSPEPVSQTSDDNSPKNLKPRGSK